MFFNTESKITQRSDYEECLYKKEKEEEKEEGEEEEEEEEEEEKNMTTGRHQEPAHQSGLMK